MREQPQAAIQTFSGLFLTADDEAQPGQSSYASDQVNAKSQMPGTLDVRLGVRPITYDALVAY